MKTLPLVVTVLLAGCGGAPVPMTGVPVVDAGAESIPWSCPTCLFPIGQQCLGACSEAGVETICAGPHPEVFHGICAPQCFADSECTSAQIGAPGWICCLDAIGSGPNVIQGGHCTPPDFVCGAPELYATWTPAPLTPLRHPLAGFEKLETTVTYGADASLVQTDKEEGIAGGTYDGCRLTTVHSGTFWANFMRRSDGVSGKLSHKWMTETETLEGCTGPDLNGTNTSGPDLANKQNVEWTLTTKPGKVFTLEKRKWSPR